MAFSLKSVFGYRPDEVVTSLFQKIIREIKMLKAEIASLRDKAQQTSDLTQSMHSKQQQLIAQVAELKAAIDAAGLSDEDRAAISEIAEDLDSAVSTMTSDTTSNTPTPTPDAPST